jgi:hypothetical protein
MSIKRRGIIRIEMEGSDYDDMSTENHGYMYRATSELKIYTTATFMTVYYRTPQYILNFIEWVSTALVDAPNMFAEDFSRFVGIIRDTGVSTRQGDEKNE